MVVMMVDNLVSLLVEKKADQKVEK